MSCETKRYAEAIAPVVREDAARDVYERGRQDERAEVVAWLNAESDEELREARSGSRPREWAIVHEECAGVLARAGDSILNGKHIDQATPPNVVAMRERLWRDCDAARGIEACMHTTQEQNDD
jgi:hypothetical protein